MKTNIEAGAARDLCGWVDSRRSAVADFVSMLWVERALVLSVGAAICALGLVAALMAPKAYTARSELIVRIGEEYLYQSTAGGPGASLDMHAVVNAEMRLIDSGPVVRAAIADVGLATLYPEIASARGSEARKLAAAERAFALSLAVETPPQSPAIWLSFEHRNAEVAAAALNALVDAYLEHSVRVERLTDNIALVERAVVPTQDASPRWPIMFATALIAGIVSGAAGLSRALRRRSFPMRSRAARALEAPVLAELPGLAKAKAVKRAKAPRPQKKGRPELILVEGGA